MQHVVPILSVNIFYNFVFLTTTKGNIMCRIVMHVLQSLMSPI